MIIDHDEHNRRLLLKQIERRTGQIKARINRLREELERFERFPDPNGGSNIVFLASELARYTQSCQDLRDLAELPRGIQVVEDED